MLIITIIEKLKLHPVITYEMPHSRKKEIQNLINSTNASFKISSLTSTQCDQADKSLICSVSCDLRCEEDWRLIRDTFGSGKIILTENSRAIHIESSDPDILESEFVKVTCPTPQSFLELAWPEAECFSELENMMEEANSEGRVAECAYTVALPRLIDYVHELINDDFPIEKEVVESYLLSKFQKPGDKTLSRIIHEMSPQFEIDASKRQSILKHCLEKNEPFTIAKAEKIHVFFIIIRREGETCELCWKNHMLPDRITPRVFRLSELKQDILTIDDIHAGISSIAGIHNHCSCTLSVLPLNWGFNEKGSVTFKSLDHNEYDAQRGIAGTRVLRNKDND